jgi:ribosomal protein S18 acetylase RimI-like enzyme
MDVRNAKASEVDRLAWIWFNGWQDAHAHLLPAALARLRTLQSFQARLTAALDRVRVVGPADAPVGFCVTKGAELHQLYLNPKARGSGLAETLIRDAEAGFKARGVRQSWLICAIGNERAARFYEKHAWRRSGTVIEHLEADGGTFPLEVWRYEKSLT